MNAFEPKNIKEQNKKLIVLSGISASGKSTWARNYVADNRGSELTERDIVRRDLFNAEEKTVLSNEQEAQVTVYQKKYVDTLFDSGLHTVIVSDTNLSWKYVNSWKTFAESRGITFEHKIFEVDLNTALKRNARREDSVPEQVIRRQYKQFLATFGKTELRPLNVSADKKPAFVFDLDGTVQLMHRRSPYNGMDSVKDFPNMSVIIVLQGLMKAYPDAEFIALSGRESSAFDVTYDALCDYNIEPHCLFMREDGDSRSDDKIKKEIYETFILPFYNVIAVFDDRSQVVRMLRDDLKLHVFQVADGDF